MKKYQIMWWLMVGCVSWIACRIEPAAHEAAALTRMAALPDALNECSGMARLDGDIYVGHNDSGDKPRLYVFRLTTGELVRTVTVRGAKHRDWEEIAEDSVYVYVADTGNNGGTRKDLGIYRISKDDLRDGDEAEAEQIRFRYPGQDKFNPSNRHNFDCEAMVASGEHLYLFSKNRGDFQTDMYRIPKVPGEYTAEWLGKFDAGGLITGADWRATGDGVGDLVLVGYRVAMRNVYKPFVLHFPNLGFEDWPTDTSSRYVFDEWLQMETIVFDGSSEVILTNEEEHGDQGQVYRLKLD